MVESNKELLLKYINMSLKSDQKISFFILDWSNHTWNINLVKDVIQDILWEYYKNDFLYIQDFSKELSKDHNIKVDQKKDTIFDTLIKDYNYKNIWTIQINDWLQMSPAWKIKILLIENIERMTISAINAFLKTCEEPLPNRIIIATTKNKSQLLDTILSRSIIINIPSDEPILSQNKSYNIKNVVAYIESDNNISKKHKFLIDIKKKWQADQLINDLIAYYIQSNDFMNWQKWLKVKKLSTSNIKMDNLLFYWLL